MTIPLALLALVLGAMFVWAVEYRLAGVDLSFVGASLMVFGALAVLRETIVYGRARLAASQRSRRQAGTSL